MKNIEYKIKYSKIKNIYIQIKNGQIIIKAPKRVNKKEIEKLIEQKAEWIQKSLEKEKQKQSKQALYTKDEFKQIVTSNAKELINDTGLIPNKITIKAIRYVILHELCHIKHMNHSKEFWKLIEKYMPEYKEIQKEFK